MLDVIIRGARILDGSGGPERSGDVAIEGARIAEVDASLPSGVADQELDARGLALMPGIIDLHTHSDISTMSEPSVVSAIGMGVTTQVVGQCGFSAAPVSSETLPGMIEEEPIAAFPGVVWEWHDIGGYRQAVDRIRPATNLVTLVGHSTVRRFVMGSEDRPPTTAELDRMRGVVRDAIADGARGFSTGLTYAPGMFAPDEEIVALASEAGRAGRPYHTHMRYEWAGGVRGSVIEAIDHARQAEVELNISHLFPTPEEPTAEAEGYLQLMDEAARDSRTVTFDITTLLRGGGAWLQALPKWARDGGLAATIERIADPPTRARIAADVRDDPVSWSVAWDDCIVIKVIRSENAGLIGRTLADIANERGTDPLELALDLVVEDGQFWVAPTIKNQAHLDRLMPDPRAVPASDAMAVHPVRHRDLGVMPKAFGTFPHLLGRYVRDRGILSLAEAVHRITRLAADRVGLADRGRLEAGAAADLVLFDPATIANTATEEGDPTSPPLGIARVMVNGQWALVDGVHSEERHGRAL